MKESKDIDFVITWVDCTDPEWQKQRALYADEEDLTMNLNNARYRDFGTLKYWFRSIERYAPWVRRIHFVTCGQYPEWLNKDNPKLNLVEHRDYIPNQYLPTFNSDTIELNLHRIEGLSEQFVYFNDDVFVSAPVSPTDFFVKGLPRDVAIRNIPMLYKIGHINLNDINIINERFAFNKQFRQNIWKWLNFRYGIHGLRSLFFMPFIEFTGAKNSHVANAFLKSTFCEVWDKCKEELDKSCHQKYRSIFDFNQWLFKYWQIVKGTFYPQWINYGAAYSIDNTNRLEDDLIRHRHKLICLQDCEGIGDANKLQKIQDDTLGTFQKVFPEKSSFEL